MSSNGGFPPLKIVKSNKDKKDKKDKSIKDNINLNIKNILSNSIVKPMIDLNRPPVDKVIDSL